MTTVSDNVNVAGDVGAGHVLGRYELLLPIASGGMAMVWAARLKGTRGFQKIVAVKTMLPKLSEDDQFEQMFLDEASLASQIRHPYVVEILDLGEEDGILYLVMEMVDGVPLNQLMKAAKKGGGIPLPIAVRVVIQASAGLHAAHEIRDRDGKLVGLVHRDVSPQNILVTYDGVTKVVDFGIAKATAVGGGATVAGQIKGKVAYMAPEQVKGGAIDRRVDVFALGIVLYALTTGKHPLRRESEAATMYSICSPDPVVSPSKIIQGYPLPLEKIVLQALSKDPAKRFATANELSRALDALPSTMRASTDEDVGTFVKSLFGERRDERRIELQHALDLADRQALDEQKNLRLALQTGTHSGLSGVTPSGGSGITSNRGAAASADDIRQSRPTANTLEVSAEEFSAALKDRRKLVLGAAAVGVLLLGGGIAALASSGTKGEHHVAGVGSTTASAVSLAAPGSASSAALVDPEPPTPEPGSEGDVTTESSTGILTVGPISRLPPTVPGTQSTSTRPITTTTRPPATSTAKPDGWDRKDPGF
ncbi:MAG: serine/threonine protein kinase [Polyangiaceae bacterium]|nr:serine/threonine protein kinase [Polyangiaceae bacterium]